MNPYYIVKKAAQQKQQQQNLLAQYVHPLAQIIAQQMGVDPTKLQEGDMETAMAQLTDYARGLGTDGACNYIAGQRAKSMQSSPVSRLLNNDYVNHTGTRGATDWNAMIHKITNPVKWEGAGQNVLSMNKYQDIFNPDNIGKFGRNGGQSLNSGTRYA